LEEEPYFSSYGTMQRNFFNLAKSMESGELLAQNE